MNDDNIGWYWKMVGFILLVAGLGIAGFKMYAEHKYTAGDIVLTAVLIVASLIVIRPSWMDRNFKTILDSIPFIKYTKPSDK